MEPDMANAGLDHAKVKALEQILGHLMMRVKNSKAVVPPWALLIDIFNQPLFLTEFTNVHIKRHVTQRILDFLFESFDRIPLE